MPEVFCGGVRRFPHLEVAKCIPCDLQSTTGDNETEGHVRPPAIAARKRLLAVRIPVLRNSRFGHSAGVSGLNRNLPNVVRRSVGLCISRYAVQEVDPQTVQFAVALWE